MRKLLNGIKGDSNPGSLGCESGILPLSYRAPGRSSGGSSDGVGASGRSSDVESSGGNSGACGSSGRNHSDGCCDPGVIHTDIRLACNISTLSGNHKSNYC